MALRVRFRRGFSSLRAGGSLSFASSSNGEKGIGHGAPLEPAQTATSGVKGRGRGSTLAEQLGVKVDAAKEEAKLRGLFPAADKLALKKENPDQLSNSRSQIRAVQAKEKVTRLSFERSAATKKRDPEVMTHLGKMNTPTERPLAKTPAPKQTEMDLAHEGAPELLQTHERHQEKKVSVESLAASQEISWLDELSPKQPTVQSAEQLWADELAPKKATEKPEASSSWMDELTPAAAKPVAGAVPLEKKQLQAQMAPSHEAAVEAPAVAHFPPVHKGYQEETEAEEKLAHKELVTESSHQPEVETGEKLAMSALADESATEEDKETEHETDSLSANAQEQEHLVLNEAVEEYIIEDPSSDTGKIRVQFEAYDDEAEKETGHELDTDKGVVADGEAEESSSPREESTGDSSEEPESIESAVDDYIQPTDEGEVLEDKAPQPAPEPTLEEHIPVADEISDAERLPSEPDSTPEQPSADKHATGASQEAADSAPRDQEPTLRTSEKPTPEDHVAEFPEYVTTTVEEKSRGSVDAGLASVLQHLMHKDKDQTTSAAPKGGSLLAALGWETDGGEAPSPSVPLSGSPSTDVQRFSAPLQSALASRLGWAAEQNTAATPISLEEEEEEDWRYQQQRRRRGGSLRTKDEYGRLKARTPEERRQRAMMSGRAMQMALEGRLHEFNPEDYTEPALPAFHSPQPRRGRGHHIRGGMRGRGRGRGRRRREQREIPNLFQQPPVYDQPEISAPPHQELDYYHEDVLSQLGIKLTQHELMSMETIIQSLVAPTMHFSTREPTPWSQLKGISRLQYLENNKAQIQSVMGAAGIEFPEERWERIKHNAVRDVQDYAQQDQERQLTVGESPFKNVKNEEAFLEGQLQSVVSKEHPLHAHMAMALATLQSNPDWSFAEKKAFVEMAKHL